MRRGCAKWRSKLPDVGTTIFTVMSRRARELDALNLGQGFPDYDIDPRLTELVAAAMAPGTTSTHRWRACRRCARALRRKLRASYGLRVDPENEITVTLGATEAIYSAIQALLGAGEEAIAFDPAYDSYEPAVRLAGGRCIRVPLAQPGFRYDWERVRAALSPRTRLLLFNSPHNPACITATAADLDALAQLIADRDIVVLSDEVYEHVVFDGARHHSVLAHPRSRAAQRSPCFPSARRCTPRGCASATAWRRRALTRELRKVHQFNTFSISHPLQHAIAAYLAERPDCGSDLAGFFQAKRDRLRSALASSRLSGCRRRRAPISSCSTSAPLRRPTISPSPSGC